jgi:hypothetical protein
MLQDRTISKENWAARTFDGVWGKKKASHLLFLTNLSLIHPNGKELSMLFFFFEVLGFELRASRFSLPPESHLQPFLLWLFWRQDLAFCPGHPGLPSSCQQWDDSHVPSHPAFFC